jgi:hypothetical protein
MLTAAFEELLQAEKIEETHRRFCPALDAHLDRAHARLWASQQEAANCHNLRPEP